MDISMHNVVEINISNLNNLTNRPLPLLNTNHSLHYNIFWAYIIFLMLFLLGFLRHTQHFWLFFYYVSFWQQKNTN